jgi:spore coat polysaccharide biosynthesis protein SpsF
MTKVTAIIQARMGSTRLPGKVLKEIQGKPILWHIIHRTKASKLIDEIIVATTTNVEDKKIMELTNSLGVRSFRGCEQDVLDRYYQAAKKFKADVIVRITADDPFKDPGVIDEVISIFLNNGDNLDYASNTIDPTYPEGIDVEVFSFTALECAWTEASSKFEREHVTPYIWRNTEKFKVKNVINKSGNLSNLRWTLDTEEDLSFITEVYNKLYTEDKVFLMEDVLILLAQHPEISKINENVERRACLKVSSKPKVVS